MQRSQDLEALVGRIQELIGPYAGRIEYGNLRSRIDDWDCGDGDPTTNLALVYETPGGSTDQINICYHHTRRLFTVIDEHEGEVGTNAVEEVVERVEPRVLGIPQKRIDVLFAEVRRVIDDGQNTAGLFGHLNRILQSEFRGGGITHLEFKEAMTYAVQYMKERQSAPA